VDCGVVIYMLSLWAMQLDYTVQIISGKIQIGMNETRKCTNNCIPLSSLLYFFIVRLISRYVLNYELDCNN
jgi:hypothetical protein